MVNKPSQPPDTCVYFIIVDAVRIIDFPGKMYVIPTCDKCQLRMRTYRK